MTAVTPADYLVIFHSIVDYMQTKFDIPTTIHMFWVWEANDISWTEKRQNQWKIENAWRPKILEILEASFE